MVSLIWSAEGDATMGTYLPQLQQEWNFWMDGADTLPPGKAYRNAVRLVDGTVLNRYWDARDAPRDESYKEDVETAAASGRQPELVYRDLRAAAESGWDFSSRWLADGKTLATVRTLSILPVDLNCLLVHLEQTLSAAYRAQGDAERSAAYRRRARKRSEAIRRLMWDARDGVFSDYLWQTGEFTRALTAATLYPLTVLRCFRDRHCRQACRRDQRGKTLESVACLVATLAAMPIKNFVGRVHLPGRYQRSLAAPIAACELQYSFWREELKCGVRPQRACVWQGCGYGFGQQLASHLQIARGHCLRRSLAAPWSLSSPCAGRCNISWLRGGRARLPGQCLL
jgi:hypothetical protein